MGVIMGKEVRSTKSQKAILQTLKDKKEFDVIDKTRCKVDIEQLMSRQTGMFQRQNIQHCRYFGMSHHPRQCLAYEKICGNCGKLKHLKELCHDVREAVQKMKLMHEMQQRDEESWYNADD